MSSQALSVSSNTVHKVYLVYKSLHVKPTVIQTLTLPDIFNSPLRTAVARKEFKFPPHIKMDGIKILASAPRCSCLLK